MNFVTSDLHFNHAKILEYEIVSRPFANVQEMNEAVISNWNDTVNQDDTVYVLGDFFMGVVEDVEPILSRLKGRIIVIRGNHDSPNRRKEYQRLGCEVHDIYYKEYKGLFFIMSHFPPLSPEFADMVRGRSHSEVVALYGHVHSANVPIDGAYHVGVDTNGLKPVPLKKIAQQLRTYN